MMRNIVRSSLIMGAVWGCFGCSSIPKQMTPSVVLDLSVKTDAAELVMDTIYPTDKYIHAQKYFVYQDSTVIILNEATDSLPHFEIYNLVNDSLLGRYIPLGKGPEEMLQVFAFVGGNMLMIRDFVRRQVAFVNLDSLLVSPVDYHVPTFSKYNVYSNGVNRTVDGRLVFENPYCFSNKKLGIDNKALRLLIGDQNTKNEDFGNYTYSTYDVSQGEVISNPNKGRLVYASLNYPIVEFFDSQGQSLKNVYGPDSYEEQRFVIQNNSIFFKTTIPYAYMTYCFDDDYVYLSYVGEVINFREKSEKDLHSWIFRFDWDGNFVDSYYCPNYISALSISLDGKAFYATIRDHDNMPLLVKLSGIK